MLKRIMRWSLVVIAIFAAAVGSVLGYGTWVTSRTNDVPYPPIRANHSPAALARGEMLFKSVCVNCHLTPGTGSVAGTQMTDVPKFLGEFHTANITSHPKSGIGSRRDEELARIIRYGINAEGKFTVMPSFGMGDADVAAVIGYLRSNDPMFKAVDRVAEETKLTLAGRAIIVMSGTAKTPQRPAIGIPVPTKSATVEYGRYLAKDALDCVACHTAGFSAEKGHAAEAFAGGFEFAGANGGKIYSTNLTFHPTGIDGWNAEDLKRALHDGVRPDGSALRPPMPRFRLLDDTDTAALYSYLRSLQPHETLVPVEARRKAGVQLAKADPMEAYERYGCSACHAPGATYRDQITSAAGKPVEQLAEWIRNPEKSRPGTSMPSFAAVMSEADALQLAQWISEGRPGEPAN